jgi:DNA-binding LacI/PurR family transcriptional regulator
MTQKAVNVLIQKMENPAQKAQTYLLPGQLILRDSVRKL